MSGFICKEGAIIDYQTLLVKIKENGMALLKKKLTITTIINKKYPKTIQLYRIFHGKSGKRYIKIPTGQAVSLYNNGVLGVLKNMLPRPIIPRHICVVFDDTGDIHLVEDGISTKSPPVYLRCYDTSHRPIPKLDLFDYQKTVLDYLFKNHFNRDIVSKGHAGLVLNMKAGLGKTFVMAGFIARILDLFAVSVASSTVKHTNPRILIIEPTEYLLLQTADVMREVFGDRWIGRFYGKRKEDDRLITVATVDTVMDKKEWREAFDVYVFDEVHAYCSQKRSEIFWNMQGITLGVSATTNERQDSFDVVCKMHVGPELMADDIPGFDVQAETFTGIVKRVFYRGPPELTRPEYDSTGQYSVPLTIKKLATDPDRNNVIVRAILDLYRGDVPGTSPNKKSNIFVFFEQLEHIKVVHGLLLEEGGDIAVDLIAPELVAMTGGADVDTIKKAQGAARIILTTYGYSSTGISITKMNALVIASPRRNGYIQILGRIMRKGGDTGQTRQVIDIIDENCPVKKQYNGRKRAYDFYGFSIG